MKNLILMFLICTFVCFCGCHDKLPDNEFSSSENEIYEPAVSDEETYTKIPDNQDVHPDGEVNRTAPAELQKYIGTWYGFGTDGDEAVTDAEILEFLDASRVKFGDRVYVLIGEYTAESINSIDNETNVKNSKFILEFGKDSNGEHALNTYAAKKPGYEPISQFMFHYRQPQRPNGQDFIKGGSDFSGNQNNSEFPGTTKNEVPQKAPQPTVTEEVKPITPPTPAPDTSKVEKLSFQQRYDELNAKKIDDSNQHAMNISSYELFKEWDLLLNDIYKYLKTIKSSEEFKIIESDEIMWIKEKEAAIAENRKQFEGGSMAPLVENTTAIEYTKERCSYLISLIN